MNLGAIPRSKPLVLTAVLVASALGLFLPPTGASAAHDGCRLSVQGPFLYAGMVFPVAQIDCDTVQQSIHIRASLDMDGTAVASASRTCRKATSCWLGLASDGVFALDAPGDQRWCGRATGSVNNRGPGHSLGEAASCESESF
jgi:hypothetical protein